MFTFCIQKDTIRVESRDFGKEPAEAIKEEINRRYANKIVPEVGLCISLLDILEASEGAVLYGDGCFYYKTVFRLIIFRPYVGEAMLGKVLGQAESGITVTLGFFDDILIPPNLLPEFSVFDASRRSYFWAVPSDPPPEKRPDDATLLRTPKEERMYIERKDWIRIRVEEEAWQDLSPGHGKPPPLPEQPAPGPPGANPTPTIPAPPTGPPPYSLICSMTEPGTGVLDWWAEDEAEE